MKLLDQYEAACNVRQLSFLRQTTGVEEFLRFHHNRRGRWVHPQEMGEAEVEARVRVYSREKTLADCFKYRNKIGLDTALEALKRYKQQGRITLRSTNGMPRPAASPTSCVHTWRRCLKMPANKKSLRQIPSL